MTNSALALRRTFHFQETLPLLLEPGLQVIVIAEEVKSFPMNAVRKRNDARSSVVAISVETIVGMLMLGDPGHRNPAVMLSSGSVLPCDSASRSLLSPTPAASSRLRALKNIPRASAKAVSYLDFAASSLSRHSSASLLNCPTSTASSSRSARF
jgi:hypothetical protein